MKIYIVSHSYDNGESYEDLMTFTDDYYYSTEAKAKLHYTYAVYDGTFEGKWQLIEQTLDTQESRVLLCTEYQECSSDWDNYYEEDDYDDYDDYDPYDPMNDIESAFRYLDMTESAESEDSTMEEYLTTPHELYRTFEEIAYDNYKHSTLYVQNPEKSGFHLCMCRHFNHRELDMIKSVKVTNFGFNVHIVLFTGDSYDLPLDEKADDRYVFQKKEVDPRYLKLLEYRSTDTVSYHISLK